MGSAKGPGGLQPGTSAKRSDVDRSREMETLEIPCLWESIASIFVGGILAWHLFRMLYLSAEDIDRDARDKQAHLSESLANQL